MKATLKMVAEEAGVSIRTAGRALRGEKRVAPDVAEKVCAIAKRLAYVPNAAARGLRSRSSRIVGVITSPHFIVSEILQMRLRLTMEKLREQNLDTLTGMFPRTPEKLEELLLNWTGIVETVIFMAWNPGWDSALLRRFPIRFLFMDCDPGDGYSRFLTDRAEGVKSAVQMLMESGCKTIVHVSGGNQVAGRVSGFDAAVTASGRKIRTLRLSVPGIEFADGYHVGKQLVKTHADGVFFDTDRMALGFYRYAHEHGIGIPEQISVIGFDNDTAGAFAIPALTTIAHPVQQQVVEIVKRICSGTPEHAAQKIIYPAAPVQRESVRKKEGDHTNVNTGTHDSM